MVKGVDMVKLPWSRSDYIAPSGTYLPRLGPWNGNGGMSMRASPHDKVEALVLTRLATHHRVQPDIHNGQSRGLVLERVSCRDVKIHQALEAVEGW